MKGGERKRGSDGREGRGRRSVRGGDKRASERAGELVRKSG